MKTIITSKNESVPGKIKWLLYGAAILFFYLSQSAVGQEKSVKVSDSIFSKILNEQRKLQIVFPEGYNANSTNKYDVIYTSDGEWNTEMISHMQEYTTDWKFMPKNIIVGIENTYVDGVNHRDRDLTPTHDDIQPLSGKADNFLAFLKDELIPYINKTYPVTGENTLFGHSHGGTFAMYALLKEPELFKSYIAADPSLWWDNKYIAKLAAEKLPEMNNIHATLYISGREGKAYKGMGIDTMDSILNAKAPKGLFWESIIYPNEHHVSVKLKSIYDGLKQSYRGYTDETITFHPMGGIVEKGKPYNIFRGSDNIFIHYTLDGSEPVHDSPLMNEIMELNGPAELKVKPVSFRRANNSTTTGHFIEGKALKPHSRPKKAVAGGLNYSYYEGEWDKIPDFSKLKPVKTGLANKDFDLNKLPRKDHFACSIEGFIEIKEEGYYAFGITSDDGSKLYLNNTLLIDNDGLHDSSTLKSYMVPLKTGFYPIRLEYFQKDGDKQYNIIYLTPGATNPMPLPLEIQYYNE